MSAALMIVAKVLLENPPEMPFVENDCVIKAAPPDRIDQSFDVWARGKCKYCKRVEKTEGTAPSINSIRAESDASLG